MLSTVLFLLCKVRQCQHPQIGVLGSVIDNTPLHQLTCHTGTGSTGCTRFRDFQDGSHHHLEFSKIQKLVTTPNLINCSNSCGLQRYGDLMVFQNVGRPPSWIMLHSTHIWTICEYYSVFLSINIVQNLVGINSVVLII